MRTGGPIVLFLLGLSLMACSPTAPGGPKTLEKVLITGNLRLTAIGQTSQLQLSAIFSDGKTSDVTTDAQWASLNPSIATVSSKGLVTAVAEGSAGIVSHYLTFSSDVSLDIEPNVVTGLKVTGRLALTAAGDTSQLSASASFDNGTTRDVTANTVWTSSNAAAVDVLPTGIIRAKDLGLATVTAAYRSKTVSSIVTVTPDGTIVTDGRARLPGNGGGADAGVPGFTILDATSGRTTVTDSTGHYVMAALQSGTHLFFDKDGYEHADIVVKDQFGDATVQKLVRINAGETAISTIAPNDISYQPSPTFQCSYCRLIRVVSPGAGTVHLTLTWDDLKASVMLWANGVVSPLTKPGPIDMDMPVAAGEYLVYVSRVSGSYLTVKLATSFTATTGTVGRR